GVPPCTAGAVARRRQQAELLVVAQRARGHAGRLRDLADPVAGFGVVLHQAGTHSSGGGASAATSSSAGAPNAPTSSSSVCTYLAPRIHDAAAATSDMTVAAENTMRRPCMNG